MMATEWANTGGAPPSKERQTPEETIRLAIAAGGKPVVYSEGHTQQSARSKAKRIKGTPKEPPRPLVWGQWEGQIRTGAYKKTDPGCLSCRTPKEGPTCTCTWSVVVGWVGGDEHGQNAEGPEVPWRGEEAS